MALISPHWSLSADRVINAGKSMLNEDQASCEKLFVKKPSGKQRNSTLLEDNRVSRWKLTIQEPKAQTPLSFNALLLFVLPRTYGLF